MFTRYHKFDKRPLGERLRFLLTGAFWLRVDHDQLGQPVNVAVGFEEPKDAQEMTDEKLQEIQQQIEANQQAYMGQQFEGQLPHPQAQASPKGGRAARREGKRRR